MPDISGPPTAFSSLSVAGVPTMGVGGNPPLTNGNYYFVSSVDGVASNDGSSMGAPLATVFGTAGAYAKCTAANGDIIVCLPGHVETLSASTAAAKSGVSVVGIGQGALRPTFTMDTLNTTTILVSAANQSWSNCIFTANFLSIAAAFTLSTAKNFSLRNCLFNETSGVLNFLNIVKSTGAANTVDGLTMVGNQWTGLGTTSVNTFNLNADTVDRLTATGNLVVNATTVDQASLIVQTAGILTNLECGYNRTYRKNTTSTASLISVGGTTSTGFVHDNYTQTLDTATNVLFVTTVGLSAFENYITGAVGASGFIIPARDT